MSSVKNVGQAASVRANNEVAGERLEQAVAAGERLGITFHFPEAGGGFGPSALRDAEYLKGFGVTQSDCLNLLEAAIQRDVRGAEITLRRSDAAEAYVFDGVDGNVQSNCVVPPVNDGRPALLAGLGPTFKAEGRELDGLRKTNWFQKVLDTLGEIFGRIISIGFWNPKTHTYDGVVTAEQWQRSGEVLALAGGSKFRALLKGPPATPANVVNARIQELLRQHNPDSSKADIKKAASVVTDRLFAVYADPTMTDAKLDRGQHLLDLVAADAVNGWVTRHDDDRFGDLTRILDMAPLSDRQLHLVIKAYNEAGDRAGCVAGLDALLKSPQFQNGDAVTREALLVRYVGISPEGDTKALSDYFAQLQAEHPDDPAFAGAVADKLQGAGFFLAYTGCIYWEPGDIDALEPYVLDEAFRKQKWAAQKTSFDAFAAALPAGATKDFFTREYAAHHDVAKLNALYQQMLRAYHATVNQTCKVLQDNLVDVTADATLARKLKALSQNGNKITQEELAIALEAAAADGWMEEEQLALLDALLDVDAQLAPKLFASRKAVADAFLAAQETAINSAMWKEINAAAPGGLSLEEVEGLVQKFAWAPGRNGTFKTSERKALEEALPRFLLDPDAQELMQKLADGVPPAELGLLSTNLAYDERIVAIDDYLRKERLSDTEQVHLSRLLRDTPAADQVKLVQRFASEDQIGLVLTHLPDAKCAAIAKRVFLGNLYKLPSAAVVARGLAAVKPDTASLQKFLNDAFVFTCGPNPSADPVFVRLILDAPDFAPVRVVAMPFVFWQPPADLEKLDKMATDATYREQQFAEDRKLYESFTGVLVSTRLRSYFSEGFGATHTSANVQAAFDAGIAKYYTEKTPAVSRWQASLTAQGAVADPTLLSTLMEKAAYGGISKAELQQLINEASKDTLDKHEKLAIATAVLHAGPARLFGKDWRAMALVVSLCGSKYARVDGSGPLVTWEKENNKASDGKTIKIGLASTVAVKNDGLHTPLVHVSGETVLSTADGHAPFANGGKVTSDAYDQVQAVICGEEVLTRLKDTGYQGSLHFRVRVNGMSDMNAYFDPSNGEIVTGTSNNTWHLGSDHDVVKHEMGHASLHDLAPNLNTGWFGEGSSIHEGFADATAALAANDPEMSEDFGVAEGKPYLRNVDNSFKLSDVDDECHARGQVYGGYIWSVKKKLVEMGFGDFEAADLTYAIVVSHAAYYESASGSTTEFIANMIQGARDQLGSVLGSDKVTQLVEFMRQEGIKREFVSADWKVPGAPSLRTSRMGVTRRGSDATPPALQIDPTNLEGARASVTQYLAKLMPSGVAGMVELKPVTAADVGGGVQKLVYQAMIRDPRTKKLVPVADGNINLVFRGGELVQVNGGGLAVPSTVDFTPAPLSPEARKQAIDVTIRNMFESNAVHSQKLSSYVMENFDTLFAPGNITTSEVVLNGCLAQRLKVKGVGEFTVDPKTGEVTASNLIL